MRIICMAMVLLTALTGSLYSQNVGIGETNPGAKLEVKGPASTLLNSFLVKDGNNVPLLSVSNMGRLGINLSNPAVPLHIHSDHASEMVRVRGVLPYVSFYDETDTYKGYLWSKSSSMELGSASGTGLPVTIAPDNAVTATFSANGNTGFGVTNPAFRLDVNGRVRIRHDLETAGIWLNNAANTGTSAFVGMFTDDQVGFYGNTGIGWGLLMNTTTGNVGINADAATAKLEVKGTGSSSTALKLSLGKIAYTGAGVNSGTPVFVHKAVPENTPSSLGYTVIDNPYCNNDPTAILIVTLNGTYGGLGAADGYGRVPEIVSGVPGDQILSMTSFLVFFNGGNSGFYADSPDYAKNRWCIRSYCGRFVIDPLNFNFNVMIIHPN